MAEGANGGGLSGNPRYERMDVMAKGSRIAAMILTVPPQRGQVLRSNPKTLARSSAQGLLRAGSGLGTRGTLPRAAAGGVNVGFLGTI